MERLEFLIVFYITITLASLHAMFNWQLSSSSLPQMEVGKNPCTYPYCFSLALRWSIKYVGNLCTRNIEFEGLKMPRQEMFSGTSQAT